jgi:hypothetical protein
MPSSALLPFALNLLLIADIVVKRSLALRHALDKGKVGIPKEIFRNA